MTDATAHPTIQEMADYIRRRAIGASSDMCSLFLDAIVQANAEKAKRIADLELKANREMQTDLEAARASLYAVAAQRNDALTLLASAERRTADLAKRVEAADALAATIREYRARGDVVWLEVLHALLAYDTLIQEPQKP